MRTIFDNHGSDFMILCAALGLVLLAGSRAPAVDTCVECHSNPDFLVQNRKLYDYFEEWNSSIHGQEEVTCVDCHGGDAEAPGKDAAHADGVAASDPTSGIHYANVPETCGSCHTDILTGFQESHHFQHLLAAANETQGPSCVTCHGSINSEILDINNVAAACVQCHDEASGNHPEIPREARDILTRFLSIHRFYRYVARNADAEEAAVFFRDLDPRLAELSVTWHTFDLDAIEAGTANVLSIMKAKRDEIRARKAAAK